MEIQIEPEIEFQLAAEARARGLALDRYIAEKLGEPRPVSATRQHSVSEAIDRIRTLRKGNLLSGLRTKDLIHEGHRY